MAKAARAETDWIPGTVVSEEDSAAGLPEIRVVETADLVDERGEPIFADPDNANEHDDAEVARLASSFNEHGVLEAVVLNRETRQLIGGHGRIQAAYRAQKLRMILLVVSRDYVEQRAANLALNAGTYGHLNEQRLAEQLRALAAQLDPSVQNIESLEALTGFLPQRIETLMPEIARLSAGAGVGIGPPGDFPSYDQNIETSYCCPSCGYSWSGNPKPGSEDIDAESGADA